MSEQNPQGVAIDLTVRWICPQCQRAVQYIFVDGTYEEGKTIPVFCQCGKRFTIISGYVETDIEVESQHATI